jgi:hypothetical protein
MAITYKSGWNAQITSYANKYGPYQAFLSSFDENTLNRALSDAKNKFIDPWVNRFIDAAMDPFNKKSVVTVEQGAHQTEDTGGGGFCLHFTGRDQDGMHSTSTSIRRKMVRREFLRSHTRTKVSWSPAKR